jgi:hypothetical protein
VLAVTRRISDEAAALLRGIGRNSRQYAIDAVVAAVARGAEAPVTVLTSDPRDLARLCGDGIDVVAI